MDSVARKRATITAGCLLLPILLYWHFRNAPQGDNAEESDFPGKTVLAKPLVPGKMPWTLDEAMDAFARQPDNAYVQYVMLQLARNEKRMPDVMTRFPALNPTPRSGVESPKVDLFSLFSGYHAIQESLQLDVMLAGQVVETQTPVDTLEWQEREVQLTRSKEVVEEINGVKVKKMVNVEETETRKFLVPAANQPLPRPASFPAAIKTITPLANLVGPTVKSHPWEKMLADKQPAVSELSRCVPADFYLVEFRKLTRLYEALDAGQDWSTYFFSQGHLDGTDLRTRQRLQTQLLLQDIPKDRPLFEAIVESVALVGSDPFVKEGSDVTILFRFQSPDLFRAGIKHMEDAVRKQHPDVSVQKGQHLGIEYTAVTTPERSLSAYYAEPKPNLHFRSNSLEGLKRVLETALAKAPSLGDSAEFRYIRTLMPTGAPEEDGLIYLSDAFIRNLVGPKVKLTEARRKTGYNHLRMIAHAAQMYRTQFGEAPKSLDDLEKSGCAPGKFNTGTLSCPFGGTYRLSEDAAFGVSSVLGTTEFLTPCCELPTPDASSAESTAYEKFVEDYKRYWRTFFDPIAVRMKTDAKKIRVETLVLPLIDNSIYTSLAQMVGKEPEPLDALPVPAQNLFTMNLRLNREALLKSMRSTAVSQATRAASFIAAPATPFYPSNLPNSVWESLTPDEKSQSRVIGGIVQLYGLPTEKLDAFLDRGIGNQIGVHCYDAKIMFDINLSQLFGSIFRLGGMPTLVNEYRPDLLDENQPDEKTDVIVTQSLAVLATLGQYYAMSSVFAPMYVAVPVKDAKVVDDFLDHLDSILAKAPAMRTGDPSGIFEMAADRYRIQTKHDTKVRGLGVRYGPVRYRMFWARIGDGLYLTNQPDVLDDLHAAHVQQLKTGASRVSPSGHAMMRIRAENWKLALAGYKLGWAENNREACQRNQSMLSAAARAFAASPPTSKEGDNNSDRERLVLDYAKKMFGVDFICPDGGTYSLEDNGKTCRCSVHGTYEQPTQTNAPAKDSTIDRLMRDFKDLTATVTILPEGLRAVVVIERK